MRGITLALPSAAYDELWAAWKTVPKGQGTRLVTTLLAAHFGLPEPSRDRLPRDSSALMAELMRSGVITADQVEAARASLARKAAS